jgi:hypothetical protein
MRAKARDYILAQGFGQYEIVGQQPLANAVDEGMKTYEETYRAHDRNASLARIAGFAPK